MPESEVVEVAPDMVVTDTLGGYDLLRRLGSGGMAYVHLARANGIEGFQKLVVLKQILPHLAADEHFVKMFLEEARLAALLDHPNIVQVFDLGKEEGEYFFTMEFVYGENLQGLLKALRKVEQVLSIENVATIGLGVAAGLQCAHERVGFDGRPLGIVHRDVSPTNVMITYEGGVKVADFGIAKVVTRTDVTRAGTRKGKVPYMSPEQCRADKIDRRSDVFSLGIVLWEAVTGERLFEGDNEFGVMNLIVHGEIKPPSTLRTDIPPQLEHIIMKALTVNRDQRYQSARELQVDLERFVCEHRLRATPSALSELMHYLFRPQPFPWGALRGSSGKGQMSPATLAEISAMVGSQPSIPGTGVSRASQVTAGTGSFGSQIGGSALTGSSIAFTGTRDGSKVMPPEPRAKALRNVAMALGSVAALALVLMLGLWLGGRGAGDVETKASEKEASASQLEQAEAAAARVVADPPKKAEAPAEPAAPAEPVADDPEAAEPAAEPSADEPEAAEPAADTAEPAAEVADADADPPADAAVADAAPEDVVEDDELVIEDDAPSKPKAKRPPKSRPAQPRTKKKKKPDLDAFMPGFGG